jgi:hypothetical protein
MPAVRRANGKKNDVAICVKQRVSCCGGTVAQARVPVLLKA